MPLSRTNTSSSPEPTRAKAHCATPSATLKSTGALMAWLCLLALWPALALAAPSVAELRQRLQKLAEAGDKLAAGAQDTVAYNLDVSERIDGRFSSQSEDLRQRVGAWLTTLEAGKDPFTSARGEILMRGYHSKLSTTLQGYAVYLPPNYDPNKRYPLMLVLHGGSANGNLFLGVVLGNNMNWKEYNIHLWDHYEPRWTPDWIVVAPDGYGHVMWRYMGERDVLDVMDDVRKHYAVDDDRIVLCGLSNGGVGAYNMGMRHAYRFAAVLAIAGAPSWVQYSAARETALEQRLLYPVSGMQLAENAFNTDFRFYHGHEDGGPMKPRFVEAFSKHIKSLNIPHQENWYDAGHDLLYIVHKHGQIYKTLDGVRRKRKPEEVYLSTGDYRAPRQHWLEVDRIDRYPSMARLHGTCRKGRVSIKVEGARSFMLHMRDLPLQPSDKISIVVNDREVYKGEVAALGDRFHLRRGKAGFEAGFVEDQKGKRPGVSGPISDAYFEPMLHVYGTSNPEHSEELKRIAEKGARGWPLWLWNMRQPVVADRDVTEAMMRTHHLVLYGTPGDNALLDRIAATLPISVHDDKIALGARTLSGKGIGTRFIYPNPLAADHYVIVQTAPSVAAIAHGHNLPDFVPDYVVYDAGSSNKRPRLLYGIRNAPIAQGFFDDHWQLPKAPSGQGGDDVPSDDAPTKDQPSKDAAQETQGQAEEPEPDPNSILPPATRFASSRKTQAGKVARIISRRSRGHKNFRALATHATWIQDPIARWAITDNDECLEALRSQGIRVQPHDRLLTTPVPTPVELLGRVGGLWYRSTHEERMLVLSCEMVRRMPILSRVLRKHGVRGVDVMSTYRTTPRASFHTMGLALDLLRFWRLDHVLSVLDDFQETPDAATCEAPLPRQEKARQLRQIICQLARTHRFSTLLSPNYNEGHRDHFHLDIRPDDPRVFVR